MTNMTIEPEHLSWLTTVPASDINFQMHLKQANADTIKQALKIKNIPKNKKTALERELNKGRKGVMPIPGNKGKHTRNGRYIQVTVNGKRIYEHHYKYWIEHKDELNKKHKEWISKNPEYSKKYYWKNREKILQKQRVKEYKLPRWTKEEIKILFEKYENSEKEKICKLLNRSWQSITAKAERLGIIRKMRYLEEKNGNWKGGVNEDYYRRIAFEHLPPRCSVCGTRGKLQVHHKDKNRKNNILSNLQIVCPECHRKIHGMREPYKKGNKKYQPGTPRWKRKKKNAK